jgi:PAS domain S-box-containing protein
VTNHEVSGETRAAPGQVRHWLANYYPVCVREEVIGIGIILSDVTERRQAEEALRREHAFLRAALETIEEGVAACDDRGLLTYFNRALSEMHGLPAEPLPPSEWPRRYQLYRPDGKTLFRPEELPLIRALRGEQVRNEEVVLASKPGERHIGRTSGRALLDAQGNRLGAVVAVQDVTEQRKLEGQFLQAQKMEAIGQLAGGVAHDFNNLLCIINGYSDLLLDCLPADEPARELLGQIKTAGIRAAALTRQLLLFSRSQTPDPKIIDLNAVVQDMEKMLQYVIGEDIELKSVLSPRLGPVEADPGHLEQVILNLVVNARDAMPQGGKLSLETRDVELDERYARLHPEARPGPHVVLAVTDSGCGMTPEVRARIFEPFFTTKGPGRGTGLGLATVLGIVKQSGGHVEVYSEPGLGTSFKVYLPRLEQPAPPGAPPAAPKPPPQGSETVLLVEDDEAVRALGRQALRKNGYHVLEAANGEEALRVAEQHAGPLDLLVTDVVMPGLGGRTLSQRLAVRYPSLKTLFVSGYTDDAVIRHGILQADVAFLQKPFSPSALAHKVREVLDAACGGPATG